MLPERCVPSAVVGTARIGDVGITQLDWKRVPQARSRGCKSSVAITAQCTVRGTTQVERCREQALGGAEDPRDSLQFIGCRRRGLYTRRISVETAAQFPAPRAPCRPDFLYSSEDGTPYTQTGEADSREIAVSRHSAIQLTPTDNFQ